MGTVRAYYFKIKSEWGLKLEFVANLNKREDITVISRTDHRLVQYI